MSFPFDLHRTAVSDSHLPCRAHAIPGHTVLLKVTVQHGRRETTCGLLAPVRLLPATTRSSTKLLSDAIPISDADDQCETEHRLLWTRKRVVARERERERERDLLHCGLAVRIFPATMRTITKDTALSEQGRGAAWHV